VSCDSASVRYLESIDNVHRTTETAETPLYHLQFEKEKTGVLFTGPSLLDDLDISKFPVEFTISFWICPLTWDLGDQILVWAFNNIQIVKKRETIESLEYNYPVFSLDFASDQPLNCEPESGNIENSEILLNQWNYISASKRLVFDDTYTMEMIEMHVIISEYRAFPVPPDVLLDDEVYSDFLVCSINPTEENLTKEPNPIENFLVLGGRYDGVDLLEDTSFDGFLKEFKMTSIFLSPEAMLGNKYLTSPGYSPEFLIYFKLNETPDK
jgi:hypothetical protein